MRDPVVIGDATRIYALCEFPSQEPRYVGKTVQPLRARMVAHRQTALRNPRLPVHRWLAKRIRESRQFCIKWLETVGPERDWRERERYWIQALRAQGADLLNLTLGGEGLAGHKFTEEHREKIAAALRAGAEFPCLKCGRLFWRKPSAIARGETKFCSRKCANVFNRGGHRA